MVADALGERIGPVYEELSVVAKPARVVLRLVVPRRPAVAVVLQEVEGRGSRLQLPVVEARAILERVATFSSALREQHLRRKRVQLRSKKPQLLRVPPSDLRRRVVVKPK